MIYFFDNIVAGRGAVILTPLGPFLRRRRGGGGVFHLNFCESPVRGSVFYVVGRCVIFENGALGVVA